jgi:hypothetical protein
MFIRRRKKVPLNLFIEEENKTVWFYSRVSCTKNGPQDLDVTVTQARKTRHSGRPRTEMRFLFINPPEGNILPTRQNENLTIAVLAE